MIAGREIAIITDQSFALHDYGEHPPNTPPYPDAISSAAWKDNAIVLSSSSANSGDGLFTLASDWSITHTLVDNNTRVVVLDPSGMFDGVGTAGLYFGNQNGVYRLAGLHLVMALDDASSLKIHKTTMVYTNRPSELVTDLISLTSTTHIQTKLATSAEIEIGEGPPASPTGLGWAIVDESKVVEIDPAATGNLTQVATTSDRAYSWSGVAVPSGTHPLGMDFPSLYVTENNRALNLGRVLRFTRH